MNKKKLIMLLALSIFSLFGYSDPSLTAGLIQGKIQGKVLEGMNPIARSNVALYAATNAKPIVLGQAVSQTDGSFVIHYNQPDPGHYVYLVANGGSLAASANNPHINLLNIVGTGDNLPSSATIDEITTIGSYQAFTNEWDPNWISIPTLVQTSSNTPGMAVSFSTYQNLVDIKTGELNSHYDLNTLTGEQLAVQANVLALCIQAASNCTYFENDNVLDTANPDTYSLAMGLKRANAKAVTDVNRRLAKYSAALPYPRTLLAQTMLAINYINLHPGKFIIDPAGNLWATDALANVVVEIPAGDSDATPLLFSGFSYGFNEPSAIVADQAGNLWVTNANNQSVTEIKKTATGNYNPVIFNDMAHITPQINKNAYHSSQVKMSLPNYGFDSPYGIAVDSHNDIWVANSDGNSVTEIKRNATGTYSPIRFADSQYGFNAPVEISVDPNDNVWVANSGDNTHQGDVTEIKNDGGDHYSPVVFDDLRYGFNGPYGISADQQGNIWVTDQALLSRHEGKQITEIKSNGAGGYDPVVFADPDYYFEQPTGIDVDGEGNVWVANLQGDSVTELKTQGQDSYRPRVFGNADYGFSEPVAVAADADGNIWVTGDNGVTEIEKSADGRYSAETFFDSTYGFLQPSDIHADYSGNIWIADGNDAVTELKKTDEGDYFPILIPGSSFYGAYYLNQGITTDAGGNVWVTYTSNSKFSTPEDSVTEIIN